LTADKGSTNNIIQWTRRVEIWSDIIRKLNIDMHMPVNNVTARQIKQISNQEPRLMAKIDTLEGLPKIFSDYNSFLLPISRKEYVIVKGNGYHRLEPVTDKLIIYTTQIPFPESALDVESEVVFLEYANSSGLLHKLSGEDNLVRAFYGRTVTPKFTFDVNTSRIEVNKAQIEVDALYESSKQILLFEAKIGRVAIPSSFSIRQIYYPYRTFCVKSKKPIRNFIFYFNPKLRIYLFWEYEFDPYDSFESIRLIQCKQYQIVVSRSLSVKGYQNIKPISGKAKIPQADDVNKIIQFPLRVFDGYDTAKRMVDAFGFVNRQSSYYRHASEILGLVTADKNNRFKLTDKGEEYLKLSAEKKSNFICRLLLEFPIINEIFIQISSDTNKVISKQDIIESLKRESNLTGSTLGRRAQTIVSWFKWIRNNLGIVDVSKKGSIRIARQMKRS
jgi:hypothetical protein